MTSKLIVLLVLIMLVNIIACNNCECIKPKNLNGFYQCIRRKTDNKEYLWLLTSGKYIHFFEYKNSISINCGEWKEDVDDSNIKTVFLKDWVAPCLINSSDCYDKFQEINKTNYLDYKDVEIGFHFGCYDGLDNKCSFRLIDIMEPMYNYSLVGNSDLKIESSGKKVAFLSERDSVIFLEVMKHNIYPFK